MASEPDIFWTGHNAEEIISEIKIPEQLGQLTTPANKMLNGPSGRALDSLFLKPLGFDREDAWLCDLLPESRINEKQRKAIDKHYSGSLTEKFGLPKATIPDFDKAELNLHTRRDETLKELEESKAKTLILLGDLPIKWFLRFYDKRFSRLAQFGETEITYGRKHEISVNNKIYNVIPLCHPRQADCLGNANSKWGNLHDNWIKE